MMSSTFPVTHVIFDMDGLLLDTEPLYTTAINNICEKYGSTFTLDAKLASMGRVPLQAALSIVTKCNLTISAEEYLQELDDQYKIAFTQVNYMPGALELIKHFHSKKIPQAIATSSSRDSYDLKTKDQHEYFSSIFEHILTAGSDPEVKEGKPKPDTFLVAAKRFKDKPVCMKNILVFEDSPLGVQAAQAAGMQVAWIPDLRYVDLNSTSQKADLIIPSLEEFDPKVFGLPPF